MPDGTPCESLTQGFRAYNNIDLIPNGFIDTFANDRQGQRVRLLPTGRMAVEFQYSIRSDISGTSLNNLSPGGNTGFILGSLGGGAGFAIGAALGCSLLGDIEPTRSRFIWHLCESDTLLNREIILTQKMIDSGRIELPYYVIGVLGVTRAPIAFSEEELSSIGAGSGLTRGPRVSSEGQIEKSFTNFTYSNADVNLFQGILYDERRLAFRADNTDSDTNCFISANEDDLVTKAISVKTIFTPVPGQPPPATPIPPLVPGDKLYICYVGASRRILRHAMFASSFFFLFPGFLVERIGIDRVLAWNFRPYVFKVHKDQLDPTDPQRGTLADLSEDDEIDRRIVEIQNDPAISDEEKAAQIARLDTQKSLEPIEGQRLVEVLNDSKNQRPYIRGFYFADSRGILKYDMEAGGQPELMLDRAAIGDQAWFDAFLETFVDGGPGFDANGNFDPSDEIAQSRLLKGFYFDVSDHVNLACTDNEKYGYQKDFARALKDIQTDVGIPNLDLVKNLAVGKEVYDLSSAIFAPFRMSSTETGAYFIRDCNKIFTYDQQFCSNGTLQADMFIRTPFFFDNMSTDARVYLERFSPQFGLNPDGGIWVTTRAIGSADAMTSDVHPGEHTAGLVFADSKSTSLNYHLFTASQISIDLEKTNKNKFEATNNHDNLSLEQVQETALRIIGYDKLIGNTPGYSRGLEIATDSGKVVLGKLSSADIYATELAQYTIDGSSGDIVLTDLTDKRLKRITITYSSSGSTAQETTIAVVFPNNQWVIDNIPFAPGIQENAEFVIDAGYYYDESIRITGQGLADVTVTRIEISYIKTEPYNACKIETNVASTFFDKAGNWYVAYEDLRAQDGDKSSKGTDVNGEALQSTEFMEISLLVSYDMGKTWYDHKGIVRSAADEVLRSPYAVLDESTDEINLFYVLNDCLMHKKIPTWYINTEDAFKAYQRPSEFTDKTSDDFGIDHFSEEGQKLRKAESYVVAGLFDKTVRDNYLATEVRLSETRIKSGKSYRISASGDTLKADFTESDYVPVLDRKRSLKVFFVRDGKLNCLVSGNGQVWFSLFDGGIQLHKHTDAQEPRSIANLGAVYNDDSDRITITYVADDMLFMRTFRSSLFDLDEDAEQRTFVVDPTNENFEATFLVGQMLDELKQAIKSCATKVRYYYGKDTIDQFDEKMGIVGIGSTGFLVSTGMARIFYKDSSNFIRGISLSSDHPILDSKLSLS